jgi:hypothetical protein
MSALSREQALELLGKDPNQVARELADFSQTARVLSSDHPRLIDEHPDQWVALYQGRVETFGKTLEELIAELEKKGLPRNDVIVRYIDREEKTLIL